MHILYIIIIPPNKDYYHEPGSTIQYKVYIREYLLERVFPLSFLGGIVWYITFIKLIFPIFLKNEKNIESMVSQP